MAIVFVCVDCVLAASKEILEYEMLVLNSFEQL